MSEKKLNETIKHVLAAEVNPVSDERDVQRATAPDRREFPYERDEEAQVTRREFCNFLALTSTALFIGAAGFAGKAALDARREAAFAPALIKDASSMEVGSALNFRYPTTKDTAILVRVSEMEYYAYGQKCTHLACPVYFEKERGRLECPCHEGAFDVKTGRVLYGPPPRPLDRIQIERRENGEVWAVARRPAEGEHAT